MTILTYASVQLKRQSHERATMEVLVHYPLQGSLCWNLSSSKDCNFDISHLVLCWWCLLQLEWCIWSWKGIWESEQYWNGERSEKERWKTEKKYCRRICEVLGKRRRREKGESTAELLPFSGAYQLSPIQRGEFSFGLFPSKQFKEFVVPKSLDYFRPINLLNGTM